MTSSDTPSSHQALRCRERAVQWQGPVGELEVLLSEPVQGGPRGVALLCHPHPLYGGQMQNKVVTTMAHAFDQAGFATVRFNFRGVGASEGTYDQGRGEYNDALAMVQQMQAMYTDASGVALPWTLAGFSFGAYIASRVALSVTPQQLWLLAPPVTRLNLPVPMPTEVPCPTVVVQGLADEVIPADAVIQWANTVCGECALVTLPEVSHFFHGQLVTLRTLMLERLQ